MYILNILMFIWHALTLNVHPQKIPVIFLFSSILYSVHDINACDAFTKLITAMKVDQYKFGGDVPV